MNDNQQDTTRTEEGYELYSAEVHERQISMIDGDAWEIEQSADRLRPGSTTRSIQPPNCVGASDEEVRMAIEDAEHEEHDG